MRTVHTSEEMRSLACDYQKKGQSIGFVPTMGFLHEGHLSLIRRAQKENDVVVVSIYVNPLQFGANEDFKKYPRNLNRDLNLLEREGVDVFFAPNDEEMYNLKVTSYACPLAEQARELRVTSPKLKIQNFIIRPPDFLTNCLCGKFRPGHFEGVATVVRKLFNIVQPSRAYFGQKDYQQCLVVKKLAEDLLYPIEIVICPTVREPDGLAMSSRNAYLTADERKIAPALNEVLRCIGLKIQKSKIKNQNFNAKVKIEKFKKTAIDRLKKNPLIAVEYVEIMDADDLSEIKEFIRGQKIVIVGAIRIGKARLIDNVIL